MFLIKYGSHGEMDGGRSFRFMVYPGVNIGILSRLNKNFRIFSLSGHPIPVFRASLFRLHSSGFRSFRPMSKITEKVAPIPPRPFPGVNHA